MPVPKTIAERQYRHVVAHVNIDVDIKTHTLDNIVVEYGNERFPAILGDDYILGVFDPDHGTFTLVPLPNLLVHMADNNTENVIFVYRNTPYISDFVESDTPIRRKVNNEFEKDMMIMQEIFNLLHSVVWRGGPFRRPLDDAENLLVLPAPHSGFFLRWAGDNIHLENAEAVPSGAATLDVDVAYSIAELREKANAARIYIVRAYYDDNNRGGSIFYHDTADLISVDDGVNVIQRLDGERYKRIIQPEGSDLFMFAARGDGNANDSGKVQDAIDWSQATQQKVLIPGNSRFVVGTPNAPTSGSEPLVIANGQGPILHGDGRYSKIERVAHYGLPGNDGGKGYRLMVMEDENAIADHMELKDFAIGNNDPNWDQNDIGGHCMLLRFSNSLIENITGIDGKGIMLVAQGVDSTVRGLRNEHAHILGGACFRLLMSKRMLIEDCITESADDDMFITIKDGDRVPGDPSDFICSDIIFRNNISKAKQGACLGVLAGGKKSNIRGPRVTTVKTHLDVNPVRNNTLRVKAANSSPQFGDTVKIYGATGGGGLLAGECNGVRTIMDVDLSAEKNTFFVSVGGAVTVDTVNVGDDTRVQTSRIGTVAGSNVVNIWTPAHEVPLGGHVTIRFANWGANEAAATGLNASDVDGDRVATYVNINQLSFVADANATGNTDIATFFANKDFFVGFLMDGGVTGVLFDHITGHSGDSSATAHGGIGRKFFLSETPFEARLTCSDCDLTHHDTVDRPFTKSLSYFAPLKIHLSNDTVRDPRACALLHQADLGGFGTHPDTEYFLDAVDWKASTIAGNPLIVWDGGHLLVMGGTLEANATGDIIVAAEDYDYNNMDDGRRFVKAATDGAAGQPLFGKLKLMGVHFKGMGDGAYAVRLGNVEGEAIGCTFEGKPGSTDWRCFHMRTPQGDSGTHNFIIKDCDYGNCLPANRVVNFQYNQGNIWYDRPTLPRVLPAKYIPTFPGVTADNNALAAGIDTMVAMPFVVSPESDIAITAVAIWVQLGGTTSNFKAAIYASDLLTGKPVGAPLAKDNTGTATVTAAAMAVNTDAMAITLTRRQVIWLVTKHNGAVLPQCTAPTRSSQYLSMVLGRDAMGASALTCIKRGGLFVDPWPTLNGTENWNDSSDNGSPVVYLKT